LFQFLVLSYQAESSRVIASNSAVARTGMTAEALGVRSGHTFFTFFTIIIIIFLGPPLIYVSLPISYPRAFSHRRLKIDSVDSYNVVSMIFYKLCCNTVIFFLPLPGPEQIFVFGRLLFSHIFTKKL
jgi:hypothetical protein